MRVPHSGSTLLPPNRRALPPGGEPNKPPDKAPLRCGPSRGGSAAAAGRKAALHTSPLLPGHSGQGAKRQGRSRSEACTPHRCRVLQLPLEHGAGNAGCAAGSRVKSELIGDSLRQRRAACSLAPRAAPCVRPGSGLEAWKHRRAAQRAAAAHSRAHAGRRSPTLCSDTPAGLPGSARTATACVASAWRGGGRCARTCLGTASARQPQRMLPVASPRHMTPAAWRGGAGARGVGAGAFGHAQQRSKTC